VVVSLGEIADDHFGLGVIANAVNGARTAVVDEVPINFRHAASLAAVMQWLSWASTRWP
jgi:hypothetical protein